MKNNCFPRLILLISIFSVSAFSRIPFGNTFIEWLVDFIAIGCLFKYINRHGGFWPNRDYRLINAYLLVAATGIVRGCFVADGYWEWKQLISGVLSLLLPLFIFVFSNPVLLGQTLRFWYKWGVILFCIFFIWDIPGEAYHFYLSPILLVACFLPVIKSKKWRYIICFFLFLMIFADFGARSQVIKAIICLMMSLAYYFAKYISNRILYFVHWFCYLLPALFLVLGISGTFNIFEDLSNHRGKFVERKVKNGQSVEEDLSTDTRTFIYVEVITSAVNHNYVLWGRTPARGNDSEWYATTFADELHTDKNERHKNEVCHPNVFTWLGLVGMVLYSLLYLQASWLAVYRSNNLLIKLLGCFVAFRWAYGWVEDINDFKILSIMLWAMIAMCFSIHFRKMTNQEMVDWINGLLHFNRRKQALPNK